MNAMKKLICLLLMLCAGTAAFAWGGREHRLIAYIAEAHLTLRTRQVLDRYLDQSIVEYSTWMDRYRTAPGYEITTYWHMVTIDKDGSVPPEPLRPNGDGDAVQKSDLPEKAEEAVSVLIALGIKPDVAERNVLNVYDGSMTVNQIVHKAIGG